MTFEEAETTVSLTDWDRLKKKDDQSLTSAAEAAPDSLPLNDAFFRTARRLSPESLLKESKRQITLAHRRGGKD